MTHTLQFDASTKRDAQHAFRLMVSLFEANFTARGVCENNHVITANDMAPLNYAMVSPLTPTQMEYTQMEYTQHPFRVIASDRCADPFMALATFFARMAEYGLTKKYGAEVYYRAPPELSWEMSFEDGIEFYKCYARLVLVGDDEAPRTHRRSTD